MVHRALAAGLERILVPGYDLASSRAAIVLAGEHPGLILPAVGVHPHYAATTDERDWQELGVLARDPAVVAIGEIGLDFFRNLSPPDVQREAFGRQLELARELNRPVLVHDRDAHPAITAALLGWEGRGADRGAPRGVLHAFSGDAAMAGELVAAGFLVSFALPVAFRSAIGPRAAATAVPDGSFLVETDSPWLAPSGAGERNEPTTVLRVAAELARLRGTSPQAIAVDVRATFDRLLGG